MWELFKLHWRDGVENFILAALAYHLFLFFRATRGARILTGLLVLLLSLTLISRLLELEVISWLLERFSVFLVVGVVVIFQPELRRVLAEVGSHRLFSFGNEENAAVDEVINAMQQLSARRCGALFALQRHIDLKPYAETGVELDAEITPELLTTIFHPKTSLHDGGVIVDQGRLRAAGCVFPVSQREVRDRSIGLRHRAGLGVTEETDAIALVVSEESGALSICFKGEIEHDLEADEIRERVVRILERRAMKQEASGMGSGRSAGAKQLLTGLMEVLTRNWKEKVLALALAFLFWHLVRSQAVVRRGYLYDLPGLPARGQL
jgi:diadenylate cyclase